MREYLDYPDGAAGSQDTGLRNQDGGRRTPRRGEAYIFKVCINYYAFIMQRISDFNEHLTNLS